MKIIATVLTVVACLLGAVPLFTGSPAVAGSLDGQTVRICDDGLEWPPYTYYKRTPSGEKTKELTGFSVDLIRRILLSRDIPFTIKLAPWKRCLKGVKSGTPFHLVLNASANRERQDNYHLSRPYYTTTSYYFYSKRAYPDGPKVTSVSDLKHFRVCGLLGYNYETYGFPLGTMDQGAKDFPALISKLHKDRCDLFLEKYEILAGYTAIGKPLLSDPELGGRPVPGMSSTPFHMLISKHTPFSEELLAVINDGIADMTRSGELGQFLESYMP
ncbi:MAG: transporter substrate-binding domain-containing protein [Desulfobacterales bacterium]|nr:transporter substrate-binding domain-containing protein [Desulfobacterales bacterium]